jgi:hypothetical protein
MGADTIGRSLLGHTFAMSAASDGSSVLLVCSVLCFRATGYVITLGKYGYRLSWFMLT